MVDYRMEEMCPHGEATPLDCRVCEGKLADKKVSAMVYISLGGTDYHHDRNCHRLLFGQQMVEERGGTPAPVETVSEESVKFDRSECPHCKRKNNKS